jgi:CBS domain-containing protein
LAAQKEATMKVKELAQSPPPTVDADATAQKAARVFRRSRSGAALVLARGKLVGILSERDLVLRVVGKGLDPHRVKVAEIMSRPVEWVGPEATPEAAFDLMAANHVRHLAVVDGKARPIGLLSMRRVAEARIESASEQLRTLEAMAGVGTAGD